MRYVLGVLDRLQTDVCVSQPNLVVPPGQQDRVAEQDCIPPKFELSPTGNEPHRPSPGLAHLLQSLQHGLETATNHKDVALHEELDVNRDTIPMTVTLTSAAEAHEPIEGNITPPFYVPPLPVSSAAPEQPQLHSMPVSVNDTLANVSSVTASVMAIITPQTGVAGSDSTPRASPPHPIISCPIQLPSHTPVKSPNVHMSSIPPDFPHHTPKSSPDEALAFGPRMVDQARCTVVGSNSGDRARKAAELTVNSILPVTSAPSDKPISDVATKSSSVPIPTADLSPRNLAAKMKPHRNLAEVQIAECSTHAKLELKDSRVGTAPRERHVRSHTLSSPERELVQPSDAKARHPTSIAHKIQDYRTSPQHGDSRLPSRNSPVPARPQERVTTSPVLHSNSPLSVSSNIQLSSSRIHSIPQSSPPTTKASKGLESPSSRLIHTSAPHLTPARPVPVPSDHPARADDGPVTALASTSGNGLPSSGLGLHTASTATHHISPLQPAESSYSMRQSPTVLPSAPPVPIRAQTPVHRHRAVTHARAASDSQAVSTRAPVPGNKPVFITTKQTLMVRNISTESESVLQTPSSLANSNSRPPSRTATTTPPPAPSHQHRKRGSSPDIPRVKSPVEMRPRPKREESRAPSHSATKGFAEKVTYDVPSLTTRTQDLPASIATSSRACTTSEHQVPDTSAFTRLGSSRRQRRVSTASMEAVNGTAVGFMYMVLESLLILCQG